MSARRLAFAVAVLLLAGCGRAPDAPRPAARPTIARVAWRGWTEAWRISDGRIEVLVVPAIGRVVRVARVGGDNLLWEHADHGGPDEDPRANLGGEKVWPWPQDAWKTLLGAIWPPPFPAAPYACVVVAGPALRLVSPDQPVFGLRVEETISLPGGDAVEVEARFVRLRPDAPACVPWSVLQLRTPEALLAQRWPGDRLPGGWRAMRGDPTVVAHADWLRLPTRDATGGMKVGLDASVLLWVKGGDALVVRSESADPAGSAPGEAAQVFATSGDFKETYVECELTAPRAADVLRSRWTLLREDPGLALDQRILDAQHRIERDDPAAAR